MNARVVSALACLLMLGCKHEHSERSFFDVPPRDRIQRLRQYSLEDQYKIFRYGNDKVEPPVMDLADPIAERCASAVPFLMRQLDSSRDDVTVRDILLIFQAMASSKSYDVKRDVDLMAVLTSKVSKIKSDGWRAVCLDMLEGIRDSK